MSCRLDFQWFAHVSTKAAAVLCANMRVVLLEMYLSPAKDLTKLADMRRFLHSFPMLAVPPALPRPLALARCTATSRSSSSSKP